MRPQMKRAAGAAFLMTIFTISLLVGTALPASATCPGDHTRNTAYQTSADGRGVRVTNPGMGVYDGDITCSRVSSLIVCGNSSCSNYVEVGWYENPQSVYFCLDPTNGPVNELAFSAQGGIYRCLHSPGNISEGTDAFAMSDQNQDGVWNMSHAGSSIWTSPDLGNFNSGSVFNNGERSNTSNTPHADFNGLQRMDSNGNWQDWSSTSFSTAFSDDAGAHGCKYSDTHTAVKEDGTAC